MPLDDTTSPFNMTKEKYIEKALEGCDSNDPIIRTQVAVWGLVQYLTFNKGRLHFFDAEVGTGKTTGARLAIKKVWEQFWSDTPVLVMVPTRADAERFYLEMETIEEGCAGVWTEAHDPESKVNDEHFQPTRHFTKSEAAEKKCLIVTHNAGKACESWVGRRDMVLVDEYPQPVYQDTYEVYQFVKARDDESKQGPYGEVFAKAANWAQVQDDKGLSPVTVPDWVYEVLSISPLTPEGQSIQKLAQAIVDGRAFQSRTSATSWNAFKYDLPFQDRTIIFSATAQYEGWQFGSDNEFIYDLLPKVDYSNVTFKFKPWSEGLTKSHKAIMNNKTNRERFFEEIRDWICFASDKTLVVCPKDFVSDIQAMFPSAKVTNYGRDVGSNEFRDCDEVYIVSEFHKPVDALRADYLGHSGVEVVTEQALDPIQNSQGSLMRKLKDANHCVHLKQMIARCNLRNISEDGKAGKATVHCMIDEDRFTRLLPMLFPKSVLTYPEGTSKPKYSGSRDKTMIVTKAIRYLNTVPEDQEFVGSPELKENGIWTKGSAKTKQIAIGETQFLSIGWAFRKGSGKGRGNPSGFFRL